MGVSCSKQASETEARETGRNVETVRRGAEPERGAFRAGCLEGAPPYPAKGTWAVLAAAGSGCGVEAMTPASPRTFPCEAWSWSHSRPRLGPHGEGRAARPGARASASSGRITFAGGGRGGWPRARQGEEAESEGLLPLTCPTGAGAGRGVCATDRRGAVRLAALEGAQGRAPRFIRAQRARLPEVRAANAESGGNRIHPSSTSAGAGKL